MTLSEREKELLRGMVEVQRAHAFRCLRMTNAAASKQVEADTERAELLERIIEEEGL